MNESSNNSSKSLGIVLVMAILTTMVFATLWLLERMKQPDVVEKEVIKSKVMLREVPVEMFREVPVDVTTAVTNGVTNQVETATQLTEAQLAALEFTSNYVSAPTLSTMDEALYKIDSICVKVKLKDDVKRVLTEQQVKNNYERVFRKNGIRLDDESPYLLGINYDGLWSDNDNVLIYAVFMELYDAVTISHKEDLRHTYAILWTHNDLGYAGVDVAASALMSNADTNAEYFSRRYLTIQARNNRQESRASSSSQ